MIGFVNPSGVGQQSAAGQMSPALYSTGLTGMYSTPAAGAANLLGAQMSGQATSYQASGYSGYSASGLSNLLSPMFTPAMSSTPVTQQALPAYQQYQNYYTPGAYTGLNTSFNSLPTSSLSKAKANKYPSKTANNTGYAGYNSGGYSYGQYTQNPYTGQYTQGYNPYTGQYPSQSGYSGNSQQLLNMTVDGVRIGDMTQSNGLGRYDSVIKSKYGSDAFIVDMKTVQGDVPGYLDVNDKIVYSQNGMKGIKSFDQNEIYDIKYRTSTVENSTALDYKLQTGAVSFSGDMEQQYYNPYLWQPVSIDGGQYWQVRPGVNPSDAVSDVFNANGGQYSIDCSASANLTTLKAKLDTIGAEDFNNSYRNLTIRGWSLYSTPNGTWNYDSNGALDVITGSRDQSGSSTSLLPGDWAYFTNPYVAAGSGPEQGENTIYLGRDSYSQPYFFGNPVSIFAGERCDYGYLSSLRGYADPNLLAAEDRSRQIAF